MGFTFSADKLTLNVDAFKRDLSAQAEVQMKEAAKAFIREAASKVPVRTGFARGSLIPLAEASGAELLFTVFDAARTEFYQGIPKSPETGALFGTPADQIFTREGNIFFFNYESRVIYYALQDVFRGRSPTSPWGSFEAGSEAFLAYMATTGIRNLPSLFNYITKSIGNFVRG